jgi:hypothetical protein
MRYHTAASCGELGIVVWGIFLRVAPSGGSWTSMLGFLLGVTGSGAAIVAWNTVGLELGTSISYPADEAAVAGILECAAELLGFVWITVGSSLAVVAQAEFIFVLTAAVSISFLLLGCSRTESKRPQFSLTFVTKTNVSSTSIIKLQHQVVVGSANFF